MFVTLIIVIREILVSCARRTSAFVVNLERTLNNQPLKKGSHTFLVAGLKSGFIYI